MRFRRGDEVLCIDVSGSGGTDVTIPPPLVLHKEYIIADVYTCICGHEVVDVGLGTSRRNFTNHTSCNCNRLIPGKGIHWCNSARFVKADSLNHVVKEVNEILKEEKQLL